MSESMYTKGEYLGKNPTWHAEDSAWKAGKILKIIEDNKIQPRSVGEVGCGAGEILNQLYLKMPESVSFSGYEISPQAFALCQEKQTDRLRFYLKDLLADESAVFDVLLVIDVFEHVEDYLGFLKKIRAKGSYKIFHIPLDISVQSVGRNTPILKTRKDVGHIHYFTKDTALAALNDAGYEIMDYFYTASAIDLPAKSWLSWLTRWPRKIMYLINQDLAVRLLGGYSLMVLAK